jgi:hypothetical protein
VRRRRRALAAIAAAGVAAAAAALVVGASAAGPSGAEIAGCGVFPPYGGAPTDPAAADQSAWNQDIAQAPADDDSADYIDAIDALGGNQAIHPDFGSNPDYGIPFTTVPRGQPKVPVHFANREESDGRRYPIPRRVPVEAGSDRHVLLVQRGRCRLWEIFKATHSGRHPKRWKAYSGAVFDLSVPGPLRPDTYTSADAAGLPILPGLVRYGEVAHGAVDHAIRVTFASTRRAFIHPATHYASCALAPHLPPMGLRLRLTEGAYEDHLADFPPASQSRPIFEAMRRYGLIVADNGSNWFIGGASSRRWHDGDLNRLKDVDGSWFEVVRSEDEPVVGPPC